jgi:hypothetical protein
MKVWKITDKQGQSKHETQWGEGVTHEADGDSDVLCNKHWLHCYTDPLQAAFFCRSHVLYPDVLLWEAEAEGKTLVQYDKMGCAKLTTWHQVPMPEITPEQCVEIAIRCALAVCRESAFVTWAEDWLSGKDRSAAAAWAAWAAWAEAARAEAEAAARSRAARAAEAAEAAEAAARSWAARTWAAEAAEAAEAAAACALDNDPSLDVLAIIRSVVNKEG